MAATGGHDLVVGTDPSYSLADVEELLRDHDDPKIAQAIGHLYGIVVGLAPLPSAPSAWPCGPCST